MYSYLWLTAFDEVAVDILGTPASEYGSLDESGRKKLVDSVVGLKLLVNVVKTVKQKYIPHALTFLKLSSILPNRP